MSFPLVHRLGLAAGATGALGAGVVRYLLQRPLPQVDGEVRLRGLNGRVEVIRDAWGIPHVSARDEHDALFAQGYCHAQDRFWQMDLNRRLACGQLAEAFGQDALDVDRFMRRLGLHRAARAELDALDAETHALLLAYTAGVNAWLADALAAGKQPIEYRLARFDPRPWDPVDSLAFGRYFAFTQSPNWESELARSVLIARLGYAAAAALEPDVWQPDGTAVPRLEDWGPAAPPPREEELPVRLPAAPAGSNGWVASGARSTTGRPLLAYDPHFFYSGLPTVFYEVHLVGGGDLNVAGASIPGIPGVGVGHNRHLAWGFTVSFADTQDFFVERLAPGDPWRTEFAGRWEQGVLHHETIRVRGRARPWIEEVLVTPRHGPLLTPTPLLPDEHRPLALKSMALESPETLAPLLALNRARDLDEFRAALSRWETPSFDTIYADVDGNVGHQVIGRVPVRARGEGLVPSPGWTGEWEWTGVVPFEELPADFNPPDGLWATANHDLGKRSRHFFGREHDTPARYRRIREVLESKERHSALDFGTLQADEVSAPARRVAALLARHLRPSNALEARAAEALRRWDGRVSADSPAASIYHAFREALRAARYAELPGEIVPVLRGEGPNSVLAPISSYYRREAIRVEACVEEWAAARASGGADEVASHAVDRAFAAAVGRLKRRLGTRVEGWVWGRLHTLAFKHALSVRKPLGLLFDVGPFPRGGDLETVRAGGPQPGRFEDGFVSGYRLIADCADWDATLSSVPGGQSGHRGSPHYADQVDAWRRVAYHPLAFSRPAVLRHARHTLWLQPDGGAP